jgi:hypothetical protein
MSKVRKVNYEFAKQALEELKRNPSNLQAYELAESMAKAEDFNIKNWELEVSKLNEKLGKMINNYNLFCAAVHRGSDKIANSCGILSNGEMEELEFQFDKVCKLRDSYLAENKEIWSGKILDIAEFIRQPADYENLKFEDFKLKSEYTDYLELFTAYRAYAHPKKHISPRNDWS